MPQIYVHTGADDLREYAQAIALSHEIPTSNQFHIFPEKTILTIDQAREIQDIAIHAHEKSLIIVHEFDTAREDSQNALLKTLEDLTDSVMFLLGVHDESGILPTVLSRCEIVHGDKYDAQSRDLIDSYGLDPTSATYASYLSASTYVTREDAPGLVDELISAYRDLYMDAQFEGYSSMMRGMLTIRRNIIYAHVTPEVAIDVLGNYLLKAGRISAS